MTASAVTIDIVVVSVSAEPLRGRGRVRPSRGWDFTLGTGLRGVDQEVIACRKMGTEAIGW